MPFLVGRIIVSEQVGLEQRMGLRNCIDDGPLVSYTDLVRCLEAMEIEAGGRIKRGQIRYALCIPCTSQEDASIISRCLKFGPLRIVVYYPG